MEISRGSPFPLGATPTAKGVNFALFVETSDPVTVRLIDAHSQNIVQEIEIPYHTGQIRHIEITPLTLPVGYQFIMKGIPLSDPYAKALLTTECWGDRTKIYDPIALVLPPASFDWEEEKAPRIAKEDLVIYEMHTRGFTADSSSGSSYPGTFLGLIEKIDHLKTLGVNAIELLPVQEFDENEYPPKDAPPLPLFQYFGYSSVNFFSLMNRFAHSSVPGVVIEDFKKLVKALHKAEIEIILDVVFNHTAEGNSKGPLYSYKALGSSIYYLHDKDGKLSNYSGCGNTLNCNHPLVIQLILDALRYLVTEFRIDGFRFDLTSILCRGQHGEILSKPPLINAITKDPLLATVKLIAEPWDAAGAFQLGDFCHDSTRWSEWNSYYRDDVRRFLRGFGGSKGKFATRIAGSEDLFGHNRKLPKNGINFITCHDGFSLKDLVSYNHKHNLVNGEENRDGMNDNDSWNSGIEGETTDAAILNLRDRQMRNFHLALMVSQGIPMLHMGDEYGHTKLGNNNTWCQDNRLNWLLWDQLLENKAFFHFYKGLIAFRKSNLLLRQTAFLKQGDIDWHGKTPFKPHWEQEDQFLAFTLIDHESQKDIYVAFNAQNNYVDVEFPLPKEGKKWHWIANSALPSPQDFLEMPNPIEPFKMVYKMAPYSSLLLKAL